MMTEDRESSKIESLFNSISDSYDALNHLLSLGVDRCWRRRALKWIVRSEQAQDILDVACGTGDFSLAIARRAHKDSRIVGLDLSEGMLAVMREKVSRAGLNIVAEKGNSEDMPYPDASFDCVTIAFGIRNFQHRDRALEEIRRVLKPGGRLVILELSVPTNPILLACYKLYFTKILPWVGGVISGDKKAYQYLPASVLAFPPKDKWMAQMRACGYDKVEHRAYTLGLCRLYVGVKE